MPEQTPIQQSIESLRQGMLSGFGAVGGALRSTNEAVANKVEKIEGKGLSQENFTTAEKDKLAGLESSRFLGTFTSIAALNAAVTAPEADPVREGSYAHVDEGEGHEVAVYAWDNDDNEFVKLAGASSQLTAAQVKALYEGNEDTNAYTDDEKAAVATIAQLTSDLAAAQALAAANQTKAQNNAAAIAELESELTSLGDEDFVGAFEDALNGI